MQDQLINHSVYALAVALGHMRVNCVSAPNEKGNKIMTYIYERKQASDLFHDLKRMGRDNFSYEGAEALMEYLENFAEETGEPIEYDPIALCCDFAEYHSLDELNRDGYEFKSWDDVRDETTVITVEENGEIKLAIVQAF